MADTVYWRDVQAHMATGQALAKSVLGLSCLAQPSRVRKLRRAICTAQTSLPHLRLTDATGGALPRLSTSTPTAGRLFMRGRLRLPLGRLRGAIQVSRTPWPRTNPR